MNPEKLRKIKKRQQAKKDKKRGNIGEKICAILLALLLIFIEFDSIKSLIENIITIEDNNYREVVITDIKKQRHYNRTSQKYLIEFSFEENGKKIAENAMYTCNLGVSILSPPIGDYYVGKRIKVLKKDDGKYMLFDTAKGEVLNCKIYAFGTIFFAIIIILKARKGKYR